MTSTFYDVPNALRFNPSCLSIMQEFLKVFDQLRNELVHDDLLGDQPESSKQWMVEVSKNNYT